MVGALEGEKLRGWAQGERLAPDEERRLPYITPSVFDADVHTAFAAAVRRAAGGPAELPGEPEAPVGG